MVSIYPSHVRTSSVSCSGQKETAKIPNMAPGHSIGVSREVQRKATAVAWTERPPSYRPVSQISAGVFQLPATQAPFLVGFLSGGRSTANTGLPCNPENRSWWRRATQPWYGCWESTPQITPPRHLLRPTISPMWSAGPLRLTSYHTDKPRCRFCRRKLHTVDERSRARKQKRGYRNGAPLSDTLRLIANTS